MDDSLKNAAETGRVADFYLLLKSNASPFKNIDTESFVETPLHVAASEGQIAFATEMMNLRPAFARTLNLAGFSPMHVALQNRRNQLVYQLLKMDKDLVRVKGREGKTPFHHVVEQEIEEGNEHENIKLLTKFLGACPECIQDVTIYGDTALHVALKCHKFETFEFLVNWIRYCRDKDAGIWEERVLNWKDEGGNTLLHLAVINNNLQAVKLLSVDCSHIVDLNAKNLEGDSALELISRYDENDESNGVQSQVGTRSEIQRMLHYQVNAAAFDSTFILYRLYRNKRPPLPVIHISRGRKNISENKRNALLVVMTLIITATYQSAVNPPGGVWSGDNSSSNGTLGFRCEGELLHPPGTTVMQKDVFSVLWTYNTLSLLITIGLTVYVLPGGSVAFLLLAPLTLFCSSYMLSMSILSPTPQWSRANRILSSVIFVLLIIGSEIYLLKPALLPDHRQTWLMLTRRATKPRNVLAVVVFYLVIVSSVVGIVKLRTL